MGRIFKSAGSLGVTVLVLSGCEQPLEPARDDARFAAHEDVRHVTGGPRDIAEIEEIVSTLDQAWGSDPVTYASVYAEADFVSPTGANLTTPAQITGLYTFLFTNVFGGSTRQSSIRKLTFLTGTVATLDIDARVTGFASLPPGVVPWQPGVVRALEKNVLVKRAGTWEIVQHQQTSVAPGVP
jgi:hypothetical protein